MLLATKNFFGLNISTELKYTDTGNCGVQSCETIREHSVTLTKRLCGLLDLDLADSFISDLLLSEL